MAQSQSGRHQNYLKEKQNNCKDSGPIEKPINLEG